jgi:hypothetical protein
VRERLSAIESLSVAELLDAAVRLANATAKDGAAALGRALDERLAAPGLSDKATLFLAGARLHVGEVDRTALAMRLRQLLRSKDAEVARGAALLLQDTTFRELKEKDQDELVHDLRCRRSNGDLAPELRLETAVALHVQGGADGQRAARKEMMDFLASSDTRAAGRRRR